MTRVSRTYPSSKSEQKILRTLVLLDSDVKSKGYNFKEKKIVVSDLSILSSTELCVFIRLFMYNKQMLMYTPEIETFLPLLALRIALQRLCQSFYSSLISSLIPFLQTRRFSSIPLWNFS